MKRECFPMAAALPPGRAAITLGLCVSVYRGPPSVAVANVKGLQPGWVRVTVVYDAPVTPSFTLTPTLPVRPSHSQSSVHSVSLTAPKEAFSICARTCPTSRPLFAATLPGYDLQLQMLNGASVLATAERCYFLAMDLPLSHLLRRDRSRSMPTATSVPLSALREPADLPPSRHDNRGSI